jgi:hypothetical protein
VVPLTQHQTVLVLLRAWTRRHLAAAAARASGRCQHNSMAEPGARLLLLLLLLLSTSGQRRKKL